MPYGVEVVQVGPSTLTVEFEMTGFRTVPIEPVIEGKPADGFEVTKVTTEPQTVEVTGPESALRRLANAVTEPVSVADENRSVKESVTIGVPDASLRLRAPQSAVVTVTIAPKQP